MVRRLAGAPAAIHMPEPEPGQIQRADIRLDRPNRIVRLDIVSHARRQKARLLTDHAGFELAIRHATNLKSTAAPKQAENSCSASKRNPPQPLEGESVIRRRLPIGAIRCAIAPYRTCRKNVRSSARMNFCSSAKRKFAIAA